MLQDCINMLDWIGYDYVEGVDTPILEALIEAVSVEVKCNCNITTIPVELNRYIINKAVGEFLSIKKNSGLLKLDAIDFDGIAKVTQLGDTKVEFAVEKMSSPEERFDALIKYLVTGNRDLLVSFRCLKW